MISEDFLAKLRRELRHVPALALTSEQASRLFDIPHDLFGPLLNSLAREGVINVRPDGRFVARVDPK